MAELAMTRAGERYRARCSASPLFVAAALSAARWRHLRRLSVGPGGFTPVEVIRALLDPAERRAEARHHRLGRAPARRGDGGARRRHARHRRRADADHPATIRSPIPFTLGISSAASFGAALAIALGVGLVPFAGAFFVTANAFLFALATSIVLFLFTRMRGVTVETFVLVGIALFFTFNALLAFIQYQSSETQLQQIIFWMMGSLARASWTKIAVCAALLALVVPFCMARNWMMTALDHGRRPGRAASACRSRGCGWRCWPASRCWPRRPSPSSAPSASSAWSARTSRGMLVGEDQRYFLPVSAAAGAIILSIASTLSKRSRPASSIRSASSRRWSACRSS